MIAPTTPPIISGAIHSPPHDIHDNRRGAHDVHHGVEHALVVCLLDLSETLLLPLFIFLY